MSTFGYAERTIQITLNIRILETALQIGRTLQYRIAKCNRTRPHENHEGSRMPLYTSLHIIPRYSTSIHLTPLQVTSVYATVLNAVLCHFTQAIRTTSLLNQSRLLKGPAQRHPNIQHMRTCQAIVDTPFRTERLEAISELLINTASIRSFFAHHDTLSPTLPSSIRCVRKCAQHCMCW